MAQKSRAHPLASRLWEILRDRSVADRRLVFSALERRLRVGPTSEKQAVALAALEHWMEVHDSDHAPSRRAYDNFRGALPTSQRRGWPSATLIRNAFEGSWARAAAVAEGRPQPDVASRELAANGPAFTREEILEALRAWVATVPQEEPLLQQRFMDWCREQLEDPSSPHGRLPLTETALRKSLGGWHQALAEIGEIGRRARSGRGGSSGDGRISARADADDATEIVAGSVDLGGPPPCRVGRYPSADLKSWLRWVAERADDGGRSLTARGFTRLRRTLIAAGAEQGQALRIPSSVVIVDRLGRGSWAEAKRQAGLPVAEFQPPKRFTDDELRRVVRQAAAEIAAGEGGSRTDGERGPAPLSDHAYRRWRARRLEEQEEGPDEGAAKNRIPSHVTLRKRLGPNWADVLQAAGLPEKEATGRVAGGKGAAARRASARPAGGASAAPSKDGASGDG